MTSRIGKKKSSHAFTFLEILFVTIILSILVTIALPNFKNSYDDLRFNNIAWDVYTLLNYAKDKAIVEQQVFRVNMDQVSRKVWLSTKIEDGFVEIKDTLVKVKKLPVGVEIKSTSDVVEFFPDGQVLGDDIILSNQAGKTITLEKKVYGYKIEEDIPR